MSKHKPIHVAIDLHSRCHDVRKLPKGVELVIRNYDVQEKPNKDNSIKRDRKTGDYYEEYFYEAE